MHFLHIIVMSKHLHKNTYIYCLLSAWLSVRWLLKSVAELFGAGDMVWEWIMLSYSSSVIKAVRVKQIKIFFFPFLLLFIVFKNLLLHLLFYWSNRLYFKDRVTNSACLIIRNSEVRNSPAKRNFGWFQNIWHNSYRWIARGRITSIQWTVLFVLFIIHLIQQEPTTSYIRPLKGYILTLILCTNATLLESTLSMKQLLYCKVSCNCLIMPVNWCQTYNRGTVK